MEAQDISSRWTSEGLTEATAAETGSVSTDVTSEFLVMCTAHYNVLATIRPISRVAGELSVHIRLRFTTNEMRLQSVTASVSTGRLSLQVVLRGKAWNQTWEWSHTGRKTRGSGAVAMQDKVWAGMAR